LLTFTIDTRNWSLASQRLRPTRYFLVLPTAGSIQRDPRYSPWPAARSPTSTVGPDPGLKITTTCVRIMKPVSGLAMADATALGAKHLVHRSVLCLRNSPVGML
jgi:hypothetical protein